MSSSFGWKLGLTGVFGGSSGLATSYVSQSLQNLNAASIPVPSPSDFEDSLNNLNLYEVGGGVDEVGKGDFALITPTSTSSLSVPVTRVLTVLPSTVRIERKEVETAVDIIRENSDLLSRYPTAPQVLDENYDDLVGALANFYNSRDVQEKLALYCTRHFETKAPAQVEDSRLPWGNFPDNKTCAICQDLIAGPVTLSCGHSFCGDCAVTLYDRCTSCDTEVGFLCPACRASTSSPGTFVRILDEDLLALVETRQDCEAKTDWMERRENYLKKIAEKDEDGKDDGFKTFLMSRSREIAPIIAFVAIIAFSIIQVMRAKGGKS